MIQLIPFETYWDVEPTTGKCVFSRGKLQSLYRVDNNVLPQFVEDRLVYSNKNVLRGLHGDNKTGKLFYPIRGVFEFFARSVTGPDKFRHTLFGNELGYAVYVPPNYINGHLCLTDDCIMLYKWTHFYEGPEKQYTVAYNDPELDIDWGVKDPILSERDKKGISFKDLREQYDNKIW